MFVNYSNPKSETDESKPEDQFNRVDQDENNPTSSIGSDSKQINEETLVAKIGELIHELVECKQKLFLYEDLCRKLRTESFQREQKIVQLQEKLDQKIDNVKQKQQKIGKMQIEMEKIIAELKINNQKSKILTDQKPDNQIKKKSKKQKELQRINGLLERQLEKANKKIIELERSIDQKISSVYMTEINRLRQSNMRGSAFRSNNRTQVEFAVGIGSTAFWKSKQLSTNCEF